MLLERAFRIMDQVDGRGKPIPFSAAWITLDKSRKTGGEVMRKDKLVRCGAQHHMQRNRTIAVKRADGKGHPWPIHIRLLMRVNNEVVL
jgi:hypothetical protein